MNAIFQELRKELTELSAQEGLLRLAQIVPEHIVFSTSLGAEDQIISNMILGNQLPVRIFTLDTGRMFEESYQTLHRTNNQYGTKIDVFFPESTDIERLTKEKGLYSFYNSVEDRKECCFLRKVKPLNRALTGAKVWITGIRAEQSANRHEMHKVEWDEQRQLIKYNPILDWTWEQTMNYLKTNHIPYNSLHDKGFVSIGCLPCTRAIREGEDFRAGRWWWEDQSKKECGLHK